MALVLIVEDGSGKTDSNSYTSVADADAYHDAHLYGSDWTSANNATKEKALVMATRLIDAVVTWKGRYNVYGQALAWPRYGVYDKSSQLILNNIIPANLKKATAELARHLIAKDRTVERDNIGLKSVKADTVTVEFDKNDNPVIIPDSAIIFIRELGHIDQTGFGPVKLVRA